MARPGKLTSAEISECLKSVPGWTVKEGKLHREYAFPDFVQAFAFMGDVAREAEAMQHHPEWFNVYNRVVVDLATHDAAGITTLDFELARRAEELAGRRLRPTP
ncbi:MAG TPA: 4a-hydroxytetrahydrobiopterin dehydratase [Candidatus Bathyarchaeia archaeon]|nr:4a-hydroxytetrahydrobiopterin dehydratase [Candidatus Bathyarchaeia archaeon]